MEYHLQVELWRGNVAGALQIARQRNELSDWMVAMAPLASHELWETVCVEYAEQLEEEGHYHKAASYLLAGHRTHQAIELFRAHKLYKEAVSLARIRLSAVDPLLEDLYTEWGQSLMKDGQFEQAAKCYLAMRQIQEASKIMAKRNDQSSLRTACHMNLLAKEVWLGLEYAFQVFAAHLMAGEWREAHTFVKDHNSLKPLLPLLSTHELLTEQLLALCPEIALTVKPVSPDSFRQWGNGDKSKNQVCLPDFLINLSDTDPAIPWEPLRVGLHTFPHHVLRHWHYVLNMNLVTSDLKATYSTIMHLLEMQKSFADIPQTVVVLSTQLTLCFISLLLSETSTAISHLLQAVSFLHQHEQRGPLLSFFCQLVLPQGPKYLLKLQQEFNASRLIINIESHGGDLEKAGGEAHSTIKKYLTDIKEDKGISSVGSRCRDMDCLRAFYYLAVLEYLKDEYAKARQHGEDDGTPFKDDKTVSRSQKVPCSESAQSNNIPLCGDSGKTQKTISPNSSTLVPDVNSNSLMKSYSSSVDPLFVDSSDASHSVKTHSTASTPANTATISGGDVCSNKENDVNNSLAVPNNTCSVVNSSLKSASPSSSLQSSLATAALPQGNDKSSKSYQWELNLKNLLHISKGILWDVQAKREALTETLGYIHRAISHYLLTNRSESATKAAPVSTDTSFPPSSPAADNTKATESEEDGGCHPSRLLISPPSFTAPSSSSSVPLTPVSPSSPHPPTSNGNMNNSLSIPNGSESNLKPEAGTKPAISRSLSETVTSRKVCENSSVSLDVWDIRQKVEQELLGIVPASPDMSSSKNRKVFWRDSKMDGTGCLDHSTEEKKTTNGAHLPQEWADLPVDVKYTQPYVSQDLLKQEQESVAGELKQAPDVSKVPFPSTQKCIKSLLDACLGSVHLGTEEREHFIKELKDWSLSYAVTSYGKDEVEKSFSAAK